MIIAVAVNGDGRREVLGMDISPSEAETFWTEFLRKLARRGLRGVKLVISDAHEGLKAAVAKVLHASWQRCRVGLLKNTIFDLGWPLRRDAFVNRRRCSEQASSPLIRLFAPGAVESEAAKAQRRAA